MVTACRAKYAIWVALFVYVLIFIELHHVWSRFKVWDSEKSLEDIHKNTTMRLLLQKGMLPPTRYNIRHYVFNSRYYKALAPSLDVNGNIVLTYKEFNTPEPSFARSHDRDLFLADSQNKANLALPNPEQLTGVLTVFNGGVAHHKIDCGWASDVSLFRNKSGQALEKGARLKGTVVPLLVPDSFAF